MGDNTGLMGLLQRWRRALESALRPGRAENTDRALGRAGERKAAAMLHAAGYRVVASNVRNRVGEADLVCLAPDRRTMVIVEVKTRRLASPAGRAVAPEASVHAHKRRKLLAVTRSLVRANNWHDRPVRIDVVAVDWPPAGDPSPPHLRHFANAVSADR